MNRLFLFLLTLLIGYVYSNKNEFPHKSTNLLFIMFDDLRPELSIYGRHHMITPNFERLAKRSVVFDNAISQISVCNPSRDSLLTGQTILKKKTFQYYNPNHFVRTETRFGGVLWFPNFFSSSYDLSETAS